MIVLADARKYNNFGAVHEFCLGFIKKLKLKFF